MSNSITHTLEEVWLEVNIEDVAAETFNRVVEGKDVDTLSVFDIKALMYVHKIAKLVDGDLVHLYTSLFDVIQAETDKDGIAPRFTATNNKRVSYCRVTSFVKRQTYRTMMVSPRNSENSSVVAGFKVATKAS